MFCDMSRRSHHVDQLFGAVLGVTGHKPQPVIPLHIADFLEQLCEIHRLRQILSVGVYILPQQGDILIAALDQLAGFFQHRLRLPAPLPPPDVGNHAVGAKIITAVHHWKPGLEVSIPAHRDILVNGILPAPLKHSLGAGKGLVNQLRKARQGMGSKHQADERIAFPDPLHNMLLLHHASAQGNDQRGISAL